MHTGHGCSNQYHDIRHLRFSLVQQLASLQQGDSTVSGFHRQFTDLQRQIEDLDAPLCSRCEGCRACQLTQQAQHTERNLFEFLTRLRPEFLSARTRILNQRMSTEEALSTLRAEEDRLCSISEQSSVPVPCASTAALTSAPAILTEVSVGADPVNDNSSQHLLHVAVMNNDSKQVQILLEQLQTVDIRNVMGKTPLHIALSNGAVSCAQLLGEYNADWYLEDNEGNTAFHVAVHALQSGGALRFCTDPVSFVKMLPRLSPDAKMKKNFRGETTQDILKMLPQDFINEKLGAELISWGLDPRAGPNSGTLKSCILGKLIRREGVNRRTNALCPEEPAEIKNTLAELIARGSVQDAKHAGGPMSRECILILTEGQSAASFARTGIDGVLGKEKVGLYPLMGKPSNVQKEGKLSAKFVSLMSILGLKLGKLEALDKDLRYGSVMLMMDPDDDGSHIKGLLINFFYICFPSLLRLPGFIQDFPTPLFMGENKTTHERRFFKSQNEYDCWRQGMAMDAWTFSHFKSLSSYGLQETKQYFRDFKSNVIDHSAYRHRKDSMLQVMVKMGQEFVGSRNNINLLQPKGQFGTRSDNSTVYPGYISVAIPPITRLFFPDADDPLLKYVYEQGVPTEPNMYVPVAPLLLINGGKGVGAGSSFHIPSYNPHKVIENIRLLLEKKPMKPMVPWVRNFKGKVEMVNETDYSVAGIFQNLGTKINIDEIPFETSYSTYKDHLTSLKKEGTIKDYETIGTEGCTLFQVTMHQPLDDYQIESTLKLKVKVSPNLTLFDAEDNIVTFASIEEVLHRFFEERLKLYTRRKSYAIERIKMEIRRLGPEHEDIGKLYSSLSSLENKRGHEYEHETWKKELDILEEEIKAYYQYQEPGSSLDRYKLV